MSQSTIKIPQLSCGILDKAQLPVIRLCLSRCAYRAVSCASTTIDANTLVDNIRCTLRNSFYWAAGCTYAATDAIIRNLICHDKSSFLE